jgi:uncharacterized membrane protein
VTTKAAITVLRPRDEIERAWHEPDRHLDQSIFADATVSFRDAPGDRGTEIHVELAGPRGGKLGQTAQKVFGAAPRAKAIDGLRHFKQLVETGVISRSDGVPEGERAERKLHQRPAQPLSHDELAKVAG